MSQKVILITGASSGLGKSIAHYLAAKGYKVYGTSRSLKESVGGIHMLKMDVTKKDEIRKAISDIIASEGRIDVLVNNAGIGLAGPLEVTSSEDFQQVFNTNVFGVLETCRAVLPQMRKQKSGTIINVSSIASCIGLPYRAAYCASKSALDSLTEALRLEVKHLSIRVCSIQPGDIRTSINENRLVSTSYKGSVYEQSFEECYKIINSDVEQGADPDSFGAVIYKIINSKNIKRAYLVGRPMQKLSVLLKRILPDRLFDKIILDYYKVK